MKKAKEYLPPIGLRIFKSAVAVLLCFLVYLLRDKEGIVFYTQISAVWCMETHVKNSLTNAIQQSAGTFVGAFYGLVVTLINLYLLPHGLFGEMLNYLIISLMIVPVIYTTVLINKSSAAYFSCVVFLSIVVVHLGDASPYLFLYNRVVDTLIGVCIGVFVNSFKLPKKRQNDILFLSGLDDTLLTIDKALSPYSTIALNQMLSEGINFTISTTRTPASMIDSVDSIDLNLPVIAMDGAVLYNIKEKSYEHYIPIPLDVVSTLNLLYKEMDINCFVNTIVENTLVIYYGEFKNEPEKYIFNKLNKSPYRNYLNNHFFNDGDVIYFMSLSTDDKTNKLYEQLKSMSIFDSIRCEIYPSDKYEGYTYIKIYNKNATKENIINHLKNKLNIEKTMTFGSIDGKYDIVIDDNDSDKVVKTISKIYRKPFWYRKAENNE